MKFFGSLREAARILKKSLPETKALLEASRVQEADQSHDQIETAIRNHLRANRFRGDGSYSYKWLRATYDAFFVYEESDDNGVDRLYRADYSIDANGALTVGNSVEVRMEVKYVALNATITEARRPVREVFTGKIQEKAIRDDGTALVKIISPGVGSSGYYSPEVLKAACEAGVFDAGIQMFANHMTAEERNKRPEGDVTNIYAVTRESGQWLEAGPDGPAVYANSEILAHQRAFVESVHRDIGVSIDGEAEFSWGVVDGYEMPIVERLLAVDSIDLVTKAGRGGKFMSLQEAARHPEWMKVQEAESDTQGKPSDTPKPLLEAGAEQPKEQQMTEAEKARLTESAANTAVTNFRTAQKAAREAVSTLALPDAIKNRIVESTTTIIPLLESGAVDVATITQKAKDVAEAEAHIAREAYGWGAGTVQNGASEAIEPEAKRTTEAQTRRDLAPLASILGRLGE